MLAGLLASLQAKISAFKVVDWDEEMFDENYAKRLRPDPFAVFEVPLSAPSGGHEEQMAQKYAEAVAASINAQYVKVVESVV